MLKKFIIFFVIFKIYALGFSLQQESNILPYPVKSTQKSEPKSYKFKNFGYFFDDKNMQLLNLKDDDTFEILDLKRGTTDNGIFEVKNLKIIIKNKEFTLLNDTLTDKHTNLFIKLKKIIQTQSFKNQKNTIIITPFENKAKIFVISNDMNILDNTLKYMDGVYKFDKYKLIISQEKMFILGGNLAGEYNKTDTRWLIGKNSLGLISRFSHHWDIVKIFGSKNIKRNKNITNKSVYDVFSNDEKIFSYTTINNKITKIDILSKRYKTPNNIGINTSFLELKNTIKIDDFYIDKGKILLKAASLNTIFTISNKNNAKNKNEISPNETIKHITIDWE